MKNTNYQIQSTKYKYKIPSNKYKEPNKNPKYKVSTRKDGPGTITGNFPLLPVTPHPQTSQLKAGKSHWIYAKLRAISTDQCD